MGSPAPDPTDPDLLEGVSLYLISQGIVRDPSDNSNTLPPLWIEPRNGTPAPGESEGLNPVEVGNDLVVSINRATGIPSPPYEGFIRHDGVEFVVRAIEPSFASSFESKVRAALNDKRGWQMATVPVNESLLFRDLQPIGSDNTGWTYTLEYMFNLWAPFALIGP